MSKKSTDTGLFCGVIPKDLAKNKKLLKRVNAFGKQKKPRAVKVDDEDLFSLIFAVNGYKCFQTECLDKQLVPVIDSTGIAPYLRLDFCEKKQRSGYFMMTVNTTGIQVTYMPHECPDGEVVLDWKWQKPKKGKK